MLFLAASLIALTADHRVDASGVTYQAIDLSAIDGSTGGWAAAIDGGQAAGFSFPSGNATLWTGFGGSRVDLHPAGPGSSRVAGMSGGRQAGSIGFNVGEGISHAALWSGTADSMVDLHPARFEQSMAFAISGNEQVGVGFRPGSGHSEALLWKGTAATAVSLHSPAYSDSFAWGVSDGHEVGSVLLPSGAFHAMLWAGTAASGVDLHPAGYTGSEALGIHGGQQVGYAAPAAGVPGHAVLWAGTAGSAVDLHPAGAYSSSASATNGSRQVGVVSFSFVDGPRAALWSGSPDTLVDLHALLPTGQFSSSQAVAIDADGNIAGAALDAATNSFHAIVWRAVPEPTAAALFAAGAAVLSLRRRRTPRQAAGAVTRV